MSRKPAPPALSELLARYLQNQASAHQEGLAFADLSGEVIPHEVAPAQPIDPRLAWDEALAAVRWLAPDASVRPGQAPPDWPALVASQESETALAFCAGNFPQLVRDLHLLLRADDLTQLHRPVGRPAAVPGLLAWAEQAERQQQYPQMLLAVGVLRLARQFDLAQDLLDRHKAEVPAAWQRAWANETAALTWHRGKPDAALALWLAQPESVPVLFNRGMAALFLGRPADARPALSRAVQQLPDSDAWHHLGRLYLALAEMRR
ncbi:MAG TPA: hypothetical protein VNK04_02420 [Gemmataceae bacterium]|nr:hypothetical protein [Gemmataceae bacterium]